MTGGQRDAESQFTAAELRTREGMTTEKFLATLRRCVELVDLATREAGRARCTANTGGEDAVAELARQVVAAADALVWHVGEPGQGGRLPRAKRYHQVDGLAPAALIRLLERAATRLRWLVGQLRGGKVAVLDRQDHEVVWVLARRINTRAGWLPDLLAGADSGVQ